MNFLLIVQILNLDNVSIFKPLAVSNGKVSINDILIENHKLHLEYLKIMGIFYQTESAIYGDYVELLKNVPNNGNVQSNCYFTVSELILYSSMRTMTN